MANMTDRVVTKRMCEAKPTDFISSALVLLQYLILANGFSGNVYASILIYFVLAGPHQLSSCVFIDMPF